MAGKKARKTLMPAIAGRIEDKIYVIRGQRVMLDRDLALLQGVSTKALKQGVSRNPDRFPLDFMFVLTRKEFMNWRSQFVTSNSDRMGLRERVAPEPSSTNSWDANGIMMRRALR